MSPTNVANTLLTQQRKGVSKFPLKKEGGEWKGKRFTLHFKIIYSTIITRSFTYAL